MNEKPKRFTRSQVFLALAEFTANIAGYPFFAYLPLVLHEKGYSTSEVTFVLMWITVGLLFSFVFGRASDRSGRRRGFFLGGLVFQFGIFAVLDLGDGVWFYSLINLLRGFSLAVRGPAASALFSDIIEDNNLALSCEGDGDEFPAGGSGGVEIRGSQLSLLTTLTSTGWAVGTVLAGFLIQIFGSGVFSWFLLVTSGASVLLGLPVKDRGRGGRGEANAREDDPWDATPRGENANMASTVNGGVDGGTPDVKEKVNPLVFACFVVRHFGLIVFLQILAIMLSDAGIPTGLAGLIVALNPIGQVLSMYTMGRLVDSPMVSEKAMIMGGFALTAITLLFFTAGVFTRSPAPFIAGQICLAFAWGCINTGGTKYIVNRTSVETRARFLGYKDASLQGSKLLAYQFYAFLWLFFTYQQVLPYAFLFPLAALLLATRL
ncbi:MAG: MFS transporter [Promethearchaeota archaeon]